MPSIQVLDQDTINKIAAGEVVERPASVVKELLENAIDAKATAITVEIRDGGTSLIRVTDNGCGIAQEDIRLAFLSHATSKIRAVEDLFTIASLGFRGEALASIAAVAQVELVTKTSGSLTGFRYQIEGGQEKGLEEVGAPEGTTFIARNLFYNTPARKKFLKKPVTEGSYVADLVEKIALSHPEVSIRLIQNNQNKLSTSGNHSLRDLAYTVYGREVLANLLPVEVETENVNISGFIGKPLIARGNRNYENYFINGRYIRSNLISQALEEAYKPYMMQHKYPFTLLHFTLDPESLDVNVHPTKMELRFSDGESLYRMIVEAVSSALSQRELIPSVSLSEDQKIKREKVTPPRPEPFETRRRERLDYRLIPPALPERVAEETPTKSISQKIEKKPDFEADLFEKSEQSEKTIVPSAKPETMKEPSIQTSAEKPQPPKQPQEKPQQLDLFDARFLDPKSRLRHKLIGQLFDTYWLVEYDGKLIIIDQHAAHEKILYEKMMASLKTRDFGTQMLNPPIVLTLATNEELLLNKYMDYFTGLGFEIEPFGGREYAVRGVPANLFSIAKEELFMEILDGLSEETAKDPALIYEKVASMSCKAAVKGNMSLSAMEANELIDQLLQLENPYNCPHGRPVIISMSKYELEKKFKRIV